MDDRSGVRLAARRIIYSSDEDVDVPTESSKKNARWKERDQATFKYVDDNLQVNRVCMETASRTLENNIPIRDKHGAACQNSFRCIIRRAGNKGMKVNTAKTSMVCISGPQSYEARSHIFNLEGERIGSTGHMKVLGFHFSGTPTVQAHLDILSKRMKKNYWVVYHLKKAGFSQDKLAKVYSCLLYTSPSPRD